MGNANSDSGWHTFPDYPDTYEEVDTVYLVIEEYWVKNRKGLWEYNNYAALCLWDWDNHYFVDYCGTEYRYDSDNSWSDHTLYWKVADLPPGREKMWDRLYTNLCRLDVMPFAEPEEDPYADFDYDYYSDPDRKWKERHGE